MEFRSFPPVRLKGKQCLVPFFQPTGRMNRQAVLQTMTGVSFFVIKLTSCCNARSTLAVWVLLGTYWDMAGLEVQTAFVQHVISWVRVSSADYRLRRTSAGFSSALRASVPLGVRRPLDAVPLPYNRPRCGCLSVVAILCFYRTAAAAAGLQGA